MLGSSVLCSILECHSNLQDSFSKVAAMNNMRRLKILLSTLSQMGWE